MVLTVWEVSTGRKLARDRIRGDLDEEGRLHGFLVGFAVSRIHLIWYGRHGTIALNAPDTCRVLSRTRLGEETDDVEFSSDSPALVAACHYGVRVAAVVEVAV